MINQWQLALDKGQLPTFVAGLAPQHPQYAAMHESLLALLSDTKPWPQLTGKATLRPGQWSNDVPGIARNIATHRHVGRGAEIIYLAMTRQLTR